MRKQRAPMVIHI